MNHLFRKSWKRYALRGEGCRAISDDAKNKAAGSAYLTSADQTSNWALIGRMLGLGWRYRFGCANVVFLHVLLVAMNVGGLGLTGLGIDFVRHEIDPASSPPQFPFGLKLPAGWTPTQQLALIAGLILVTALVNTLVRYIAALAVANLTQRILVQLRSDVYDKLQRLSFRFFDHNQSSSIINRAAGDVGAVRIFVDGVIIKVLTVVLSLAVYVGYMLSMHVTLTLVCLVTSPLLWWGAAVFSRRVQPEYVRNSGFVDNMVLTLVESVQGIHVVKGFARESEQIEKFTAANALIRDKKEEIFWTLSMFQPVMGFVTQINMMILLGYGGYLVIQGELMLGAGLFVFANLLHEFANQVGQITNIANSIQSSLTGAQRVFEILDAPVEIASPPHAVRLPRARGAVRFENVSFAYDADEQLLEDISFDVEPGQCVAIVGETGSGKSTLLSLIPRYYDVNSGGVLVDGVDVRRLDLDDLRRNIGIVFQENFLFSNTVASNISFGHPSATDDDIQRAATIAAAAEFINELPEGYNTLIGEQGSNLSGGQRQRLAIARALLLDPPILLLDDATASVDSETEHEIQQAIAGAMHGRTTFLIANRVSTLRRADVIFVMDEGKIVQVGTHNQLLAVEGPYRRLAELQFADLMNEEVDSAQTSTSIPTPAAGGTA